MIAAGFSDAMHVRDETEVQRTRRIALAVLVLVAAGVYVGAYVIFSPMPG